MKALKSVFGRCSALNPFGSSPVTTLPQTPIRLGRGNSRSIPHPCDAIGVSASVPSAPQTCPPHRRHMFSTHYRRSVGIVEIQEKVGWWRWKPVGPNIAFGLTKRTKIVATCRDVSGAQTTLKMLSRLGLCPEPPWESLQRPPDLLAEFEEASRRRAMIANY